MHHFQLHFFFLQFPSSQNFKLQIKIIEVSQYSLNFDKLKYMKKGKNKYMNVCSWYDRMKMVLVFFSSCIALSFIQV